MMGFSGLLVSLQIFGFFGIQHQKSESAWNRDRDQGAKFINILPIERGVNAENIAAL